MREWVVQLLTYINLHLLVDSIVHDQAMRQPNSMRLHGMSSNISIVSDVGVVEVCNPFLRGWAIRWRLIDRRCEGGHFGRRSCEENADYVVLSRL
jgi:hypothetical protein